MIDDYMGVVVKGPGGKYQECDKRDIVYQPAVSTAYWRRLNI